MLPNRKELPLLLPPFLQSRGRKKAGFMHYYQFNIGDYSSHTRHLSLMEDLAYRRLLELYYLHERPFGDCYATVARLIGMSEHQKEVETVLIEFFEHIDGYFINPRADEEIAHYHEKVEKASRAGKASAEVRRNKGSTDVEHGLNVRSTDVQPTNNHKPRTKNQKKDANKLACPPEVEQQVWDDWYALRKA